MISYKGKTFCKCNCVNKSCSDKLTRRIELDAKNFGLPISLADFSGTCRLYKSPKTVISKKKLNFLEKRGLLSN